jgi:putative aldouronate transport system permease protein
MAIGGRRVATTRGLRGTARKIRNDAMYYIMFLPVLVFTLVFCYAPMVGVSLAFFKFTPFKRKFIGFDNFLDLFSGIKATSFWRAFGNTLFLSVANLVLATLISVLFALLLNELVSRKLRGGVQTILYLPHFMSWVVVASIFTIILSPQNGFINNLRGLFGAKSIYFLAEEKWWTPVYLFICRWRDTGWGTIIYLAALSGISPELYEAAEMDGAGKFRQAISITLPALSVTIVTVFILNLGKVMNIFESAFVLQNPNVLNVADVLTTFAYRVGIQQGDYGMGTAIDLFKSLIGLTLVLLTDAANKRIRGSSFL